MLTKRLSDVKIEDIQALVGVAESRHLDFKSAAIGGSDRDRKEFLADVSALANSSGGDILIGVEEEDGVATAVPGIMLADVEKEKLRLGDLIRLGIEPRLSHFDVEWLSVSDSRGVLIVRVPRSWTAPHRVTLLGHDKFYLRNSSGKHPMNTDELRRAFTFAQSLVQRIEEFRGERLSLLSNDEGPFPMQAGGPKLVVHLVPLTSFANPPNLIFGPDSADNLRPFAAQQSWDCRHTLEGFATFAHARGATFVRAYTLAFRSGIIEVVALLGQEQEPISIGRIERCVIETWPRSLAFFEQHAIEPPLYLFISLLRVRGGTVTAPPGEDLSPVPFRRHQLLLAPLELSSETFKRNAHALFRPLFDNVADAFGLPRSFNYQADGSWLPRE